MSTTTHAEFGHDTEALEVASAFADQVRGKTVLVTGVNLKGIGFPTAQAFASQSAAHVILAGRNLSKVGECVDALKKEFPNVDYRPLQLDLSSQKSVRAAAAELLSWADVPSIDIVVNSAGVALLPERTLNEDGIEMHLATNHIGHFLFTCLISPRLVTAAQRNPNRGATRIINVSALSPTKSAMRWSDLYFDKVGKELPEAEQPPYALLKAWGIADPELLSYVPLEAYSQSKVANVLFSIGINRRLYEKYGILSLAIHPGVITTELGRDGGPEVWEAVDKLKKQGYYKGKTHGAGASTSVTAALDPKLGLPVDEDGKENVGVYLLDCQIYDKLRDLAVSNSESDRLWKLSEELVKQEFSW